METALEGDESLSKTAKVTSFEDYKLALYSAGQDVMSDCLDQSESFFSLLLSNEEAGKLVLDSIARRVYAAQHGKDAK